LGLYPGPLDYLWLENWCPWMDESERDSLLSYKGHWYSTGSLGEHLEIDNTMRKDLWLWTMRPNDVEWEKVQLERRQRQYMKTQAKRRRNGVRTRAEYEANSARSQAEALRISRRKYYRLGLHKTGGTGLSPVSLPVGTGDSPVPPSKPRDQALAGNRFQRRILVMTDRESLQAFLTAIDASPRGLRRDACGDMAIIGKDGTIYQDGNGYLLCVTTGESARRWVFIKKRLAFCRVTQDGDDEGCLHVDRVPAPHEAEAIREALGIRKRKNLSADALAILRDRLPPQKNDLSRPPIRFAA
jgi:hypothetical protein